MLILPSARTAMSASNKRIPRNMARIEYLACRDLVDSLLVQGFDKRKIHTRLLEEGRITMSYAALCKVMIEAANSTLFPAPASPPQPEPTRSQPPAPKPAQSSGPRIVKTEQTPFPDPRKMRVEDAI